MTLVAGVDSSTQSCKVVIVDSDTGVIVRSGRRAHPVGTEVDPEAWWEALLGAVADAGGFDDVAAVSIAGQQHGLVALDADGAVIRPALLWNDTRSADAARALRDELGDGELVSRTGLVPVASFTLTKLRWMRDAEPERAARVAAVALPHDWLTWRLRGNDPAGPGGADLGALTTDRSDASGTGWFRPDDDGYELDLLAHALGHVPQLPRVLAADESAGVTAALPGIPAGIAVAAGAGDNAAAALGLGAATGDAVISLGTSGTVFAVTGTAIRDESGTIAGFADASGEFLPLVATLNAAQVLDVTADLLGVDHDELSRLALSAEPGSGGVVLIPHFAGERTPDLPDATGSLLGMTYANATRENLARAAVEGMLSSLTAGLDAIRDAGVEVRRVLLIGGAARSDAVARIAPSVFGTEVVVPRPDEYVARGAAVQAAWVSSGKRPAWPAEGSRTVAADPDPHIRLQYERERRRVE